MEEKGSNMEFQSLFLEKLQFCDFCSRIYEKKLCHLGLLIIFFVKVVISFPFIEAQLRGLQFLHNFVKIRFVHQSKVRERKINRTHIRGKEAKKQK